MARSISVLLTALFAVLVSICDGAKESALVPVSPTGLAPLCYQRCYTPCDPPGSTNCKRTCLPECFAKGCMELADRKYPCEQTCTKGGECWRKCSKCCKPYGLCMPVFCQNECYAPGCKRLATPSLDVGVTLAEVEHLLAILREDKPDYTKLS